MTHLKNHLLSNATLKVTSLILGFSFWILLDSHHVRTIDVSIPLCFYGDAPDRKIETVDQITVSLQGKRSELQTLELHSLAVHIDANSLSVGINPLKVDATTLFLPPTIKLIHYTPSNCCIKVLQKVI